MVVGDFILTLARHTFTNTSLCSLHEQSVNVTRQSINRIYFSDFHGDGLGGLSQRILSIREYIPQSNFNLVLSLLTSDFNSRLRAPFFLKTPSRLKNWRVACHDRNSAPASWLYHFIIFSWYASLRLHETSSLSFNDSISSERSVFSQRIRNCSARFAASALISSNRAFRS